MQPVRTFASPSTTHSRIDEWRKPGFLAIYRPGRENFCPGCGGRHWSVGRIMAECAFCATALPLEVVAGHGFTLRIASGSPLPSERPDHLRRVA